MGSQQNLEKNDRGTHGKKESWEARKPGSHSRTALLGTNSQKPLHQAEPYNHLENGRMIRFVRFWPPLTFKDSYIVFLIPERFTIFIGQIEPALFISFELYVKLSLRLWKITSDTYNSIHALSPHIHIPLCTRTWSVNVLVMWAVPPCLSPPCSLPSETDVWIDPNNKFLGLLLLIVSVESPDRG